MKFYPCLLVLIVLLLIGCEKENNTENDTLTLSQFDIVKSWEIVSVEGVPYNPIDTSSIWTFKKDSTYNWVYNFPNYYNGWGTGTYYLENNNLHLTSILPENSIVDTIIELTITNNNTEFSFLDTNNDKWIYQIAETEPEYSKSISFYEQESYSGDCSSRPSGTVCLKFNSDNYIWLISASGGGCDDNLDYYSEGRYVYVACGGRIHPFNNIEYHHILNTNLVKKVIKPF